MIFDDSHFESTSADIVDYAFSMGVCQFLNVKGILKTEKMSKI